MAQLIVRRLSDEIAKRLKQRARAHGNSVEEEHRQILRQALINDPQPESFKEFLLRMPAVGLDSDFDRNSHLIRNVDIRTDS